VHEPPSAIDVEPAATAPVIAVHADPPASIGPVTGYPVQACASNSVTLELQVTPVGAPQEHAHLRPSTAPFT
jgi:hypothetical protein